MRPSLLAALAAAGLVAGAAAPPASAAPTTARVAGQQTMLAVAPSTAAALRDLGVRVSLAGGATVERSGLTFPVTGGRADPSTLRGTVEHRGRLIFSAGDRRLVLDSPSYTIRRGLSTLYARVGGDRVAILRLGLDRARVRRDGLATAASRISGRLTAVAATALNRTFGVSAFRRGLRFGTVRTELSYADVVFRGGATLLALDPGTAAALASLGVAPSPIGPASAQPDGRLAFPVTGGRVDAESLAGAITHSGGLALTKGATRVELRAFTIDIDDSPALSALLGDQRVEIAKLDASAVARAVDGRDVTVGNVTAVLTNAAADALNQAFGVSAFREGLPLGIATVAGRAR